MALELGQQTVELGALVRRAAEESYLALRELVEKSRAEAEAETQGKEGTQRSDTQKKIDLLKFVDRTRQRMLRLHVLAKWCQQANVLRQGRWKDAIKSELISDSSALQSGSSAPEQLGQDGELDLTGFRIPGLKLNYWLDDKSTGSAESDLSPFIRIEAGKDMMIKCLHSSFILDPLTDKEAILSIDMSCIDVEALILKAIACNRHTRLLEIQRELNKNVQICHSSNGVFWKREVHVDGLCKKVDEKNFENPCPNELLQIRAYGKSYIHLGINIRIRILFMLLMVYSQFQVTLQIPKSVLYSSDFMVMGFPQCANAYYLLIQLDNDLKPVFHLLETRIDGSNKSNADATTGAKEAVRFNRIDISHMQIGENECCLNLFDSEEVLQDMDNYNRNLEGRPLRQSGNGEFLSLVPSFSHFLSAADEVFRCNQCSSTATVQVGLEGVDGAACMPELDRSIVHSDMNCMQVMSGVTINSNQLSSLNYVKDTNAFSSSGPQGVSFISSDCKSSDDLSSLRSPGSYGIGGASKSTQFIPSDGQQALGNISAAKSGGVSRKRALSEFLWSIPSLQQSGISDEPRKPRKVPQHIKDGVLKAHSLHTQSGKTLTYGNILTDQNYCVTSSIYASVLRHVIKHCSLCIKYAQLTAQMDSLGIPYAEEVALQSPSSNLWLRLPFVKDDSWKHVCLHLGKAGRMSWDVRVNDSYYGTLFKLHGGSTATEWGSGVRVADTSEIDSHITFDDDGVVLTYHTVEADSIQRLVSDLRRLSNTRSFSHAMRRLIGVKVDDELDQNVASAEMMLHPARRGSRYRLSEQMRKPFRIEAVGLMSLWFSYGAVPMVHFVVEWEAGNCGSTMRVSPDQLWPHTKLLEGFVNMGEVASFLDCIRLTAGPLLALASAIRPAKMPVTVPTGSSFVPKQNNILVQGTTKNDLSSTTMPNVPAPLGPGAVHLSNHNLQSSVLSAAGRGPGLVASSSLPFDVSVVLRGPYWLRIIYRKTFSVDVRCFAGDQVWMQPATPPKGGPSVGGSLPCPQFRPFIMELLAQSLNAFEPSMNARHSGAQLKANANTASGSQQSALAPNRFNGAHGVAISRPTSNVGNQVAVSFSRPGGAIVASKSASRIGGALTILSPGTNVPSHMKGDLSTAFTGLGDDGGYGGTWVPLAALKKVFRGILKYFGVLWLFSQFPELVKEILGSLFKENEGALLNLDQEQPALRFFVGRRLGVVMLRNFAAGRHTRVVVASASRCLASPRRPKASDGRHNATKTGYVFAVSVQRVQLLLQVLSVKRFHHQPQQQQQTQKTAQEELASDINEICDFFNRRVACEPYDASRVASFITLLTLPISVLREFIKLFAWKKSQSQGHGGISSSQRSRVELCLEKHQGSVSDGHYGSSSPSKSNINHDRANHSVDFGLTFILDHALIRPLNVSGGASWLPYCVSVRLRYTFEGSGHISFLAMEGSHGGKACWLRYEDWERCKQTVARAVETSNNSPAVGDAGQGRLGMVAELIHKQLQLSLQQLKDGPFSAGSNIS
ncbi:hypothetical protein PR202_gb23940 [Eleusine coracana subsp. coracana]|uniref:Mediator of RNA polymerase II transcription subunit 14 n=1 Tax=Eleusine coracana subsp. coracana TaxID=191504 RepID=A0AAV5FJZ4_ELECO|nr:hypothetical protein PR202_gb23928 [Eleusine coracana subsp. coracana]GJN35193.1 hypothetical protein PR202_gb23940 [Eleusine coracana subsp. coracana]